MEQIQYDTKLIDLVVLFLTLNMQLLSEVTMIIKMIIKIISIRP